MRRIFRLPPRRSLRVIVPAAGVLLLRSAGAFAATETGSAGSYWDGLWWSISLMTTVGFAGAAPVTVLGKLLAAVLMLVGFALLAMTTAGAASLFVREDELPEEARERAFERRILDELGGLGGRLDTIERRLAMRSSDEPGAQEEPRPRPSSD